jgi:electron transfer flavoprotein alpha subunit
MAGILVLADHAGGEFKGTAAELLGKATELAGELGTTVIAAVLGDAPAATLGGFGASKVYQASGDFGTYNNGAVTDALTAIIKAADPDYVLLPSTYAGRDAAPRLAARFESALSSDTTGLKVEGGKLVGTRPMYAGRAFADVVLNARPGFAAVRGNSFPKAENNGGTAPVETVSWEATTPSVTVVETLAPDTTGPDLGSADKVVAGGRSLKSKENFDSVIRTLASSMGAAVGASRAATDAGQAPHAEQVGQTGQTVSPNLYIALGISGAIQHLAGMRSSNVIVAINKDPDAPIFEHATYGIVDDLFEVAPALKAEVESLG